MSEYRQHRYRAPQTAADIWLVRHGESAPARPGESFPMMEGHGDPPLHEDGHAQAEHAGARLAAEAFDALYVTTLQRTHQTAAPLARRLEMEPKVERDLREVRLGDWDGGLYRIKAAERDPIFMKAWLEEEWGHIPNAETTAEVQARVSAALGRIATAHVGQKVACFVHGGVIAAAMSIATGSRPFAFMGAANASITRLVIEGDRMIVRGFNDVSHLPGDLV